MEQPNNSVNDYIGYIRQQVALLGSNDSEFSRLDEILNKFNSGEITEEEAKKQANEVLKSKQDYR